MAAWDAVVVGGGPAGLSCALWLARFQRRVCVFDTAEPRNEPAWAVHGYPGVPEPSPTELRGLIRGQARAAGAQLALDGVTRIDGTKNAFQLETAANELHESRRVVLAYGLIDRMPDVPGLLPLYGQSVFHCADCDGPEAAGHDVVVIGHDRAAAAVALYLLHWTDRVTLLANGRPLQLDERQRAVLSRNHVPLEEQRISRLETRDGALLAVQVESGARLAAQRIFFHLGSEPRCALARELGCRLDSSGYLAVDRGQETSTPGVYAAGDITGHPHLASIAAADGVRAALSIHRSLLPPELEL